MVLLYWVLLDFTSSFLESNINHSIRSYTSASKPQRPYKFQATDPFAKNLIHFIRRRGRKSDCCAVPTAPCTKNKHACTIQSGNYAKFCSLNYGDVRADDSGGEDDSKRLSSSHDKGYWRAAKLGVEHFGAQRRRPPLDLLSSFFGNYQSFLVGLGNSFKLCGTTEILLGKPYSTVTSVVIKR